MELELETIETGLETMETLGDDGDKAGESLLMDRAVLGG